MLAHNDGHQQAVRHECRGGGPQAEGQGSHGEGEDDQDQAGVGGEGQQIQVKREMFEEREQGQMGVVATGEVVLCNHISKNVVIYLI